MEKKKKVLVITYYWPPSGGSGVQRWLKFAKYLGDFGWEPVIYTPSNPEMPVEDHSLMADIPPGITVLKNKIWEPYEWYKRFAGRKGEKISTGFLNEKGKGGLKEKIAVWLRGNIFIPDARKFWINPSFHFLKKYLAEHPVDAVVSTGPPHSMHLIALKLKRNLNIKWVADFRDPWTNIDFYNDLLLSGNADRKHRRLEKEVLEEADAVVAIGKTLAEELEQIGNKKVHVITNGFDPDDVAAGNVERDKKFSIAHVGTLVKSRNPENLWKAISNLAKNNFFNDDLLIKLVGKVDYSVTELLEKYDLKKYVEVHAYLPHNEVTRMQQKSQVLLLVLNNTPNAKGIITGKLFEYLAAGSPLLCIGNSSGDAADIIRSSGSGVVCDFEDYNGIEKVLKSYYEQFKAGKLSGHHSDVNKYSRKSLSGDMANLLNHLS